LETPLATPLAPPPLPPPPPPLEVATPSVKEEFTDQLTEVVTPPGFSDASLNEMQRLKAVHHI
jgi:hypothetical protein